MADRVDERDRATAGHGGHTAADQVPVHDQDSRRLRAARELMRGQEDGILVIASPRGGGGTRIGTYGPAAA